MHTVLRSLEQTPRDEIPDVLGDLERVRAVLWARWVAPEPAKASEGPPGPQAGPLLSADQVAERLGVSRRWVYRHRKALGGRKVGAKVRFSEDDLRRYLERRG